MAEEIIGREAELDSIEGFLASFTDRPAVLVLEGEAGIGKTTLWRHAVGLARDCDCRVLACAPAGGEARLSFAAVGDLLDSVLDDVLSELPAPRRRALEVALLLAEPSGVPPDQRAVALAFLSALRILARGERVLLAIDDVQWLDPSSAATLEFAARRLGAEPIGFLLSRRVEGSSKPPLGLEPGPTEPAMLRIGPLTLGAVRHLLRLKLGATLTRPTLRRVHAASGGNPFFALEIARALERRGGEPDPGRPLAIPGTLQEIVKERLASLPANTQVALATAAALAQPSVLTVPLEDLDAAVEAGVIELDGERIRFTHPLLASTAYAAVGVSERRRIHQRLAMEVGDAEERARHLALGATAADAEVALALDEAVLEASSRGATDTACEFAELAVRLTPLDQSEALVRRKLALAELQIRAGEVPRARSALEGLLEELPAGLSRAEVLHRLSGTRADDMSAAIHLAEQAAREAGDDHALLSSIHQNLSSFFLWRDGLEPARREARAALEFGERSADAAQIASNMATIGFQDDLAGEPRGWEFWERAIAYEDVASVPIYWGPRLAYGIHLTFQGQLAEARSTLQDARDRVAAESYEWAVAEVEFQLAEVERRAGNWPLALRHAETCLHLVEEMDLEQDQGSALYSVAMVEAHLGLVDRARQHAEAGLAFGEATGDAHSRVLNAAALGFLELSLGNHAAADLRLRPVWPFLVSRGYGEPSFAAVLPNEIEALIALGELGDAGKLLGQLEEQGRALGTPWALSQASRYRGLLCAAEGDLEVAVVHLEQALDEHEQSPEPFERGRTLLALGQVLRRTKRKRAPRESLLEALDIFDRLGAPLWADKAKAELGRIGGRRPAGEELTPTERRLSELVAEGLSNKEAAAALFVTPRTVEQKLSGIYAKLGIHSRTELARWVLKELPGSKV